MYLAIMICFTSHTALEFWTWLARTGSNLERPQATSRSLLLRPCSPAAEIQIACQHFHDQTRPIHVLVPEKTGKSSTDMMIYHRISSDPPRGTLFKLGNDLCVVSPEYAFLQYCPSLSRVAAIRLASELCSPFVYDENDLRGFMKCEPIMTIASLVSLAQASFGAHGAKSIRAIIPYVITNGASPREIAAALLLSLPMRMGGYGLEKPLLNECLALSRSLKEKSGRPHITADMLWQNAQVALEYDSDAFHSERVQIANDSRRRKVLEELGLTVITLTNEELKSSSDLQHIAERIAKASGKRFRITIPDFGMRNRHLRTELLSRGGSFNPFR